MRSVVQLISTRVPSHLVLVALIALAGLAGCGGDGRAERADGRGPAPSAEQRRAAQAATVALRTRGALIAGPIAPAAAFDDAACEPSTDDPRVIECAFGTSYYNNMEPTWFAVRLQPDGSLSKVLGRRAPVAGAKSSAQAAALLASDDSLQNAPSRTRGYACRRESRVEPDGTRATTGAVGQLCNTHLRVSRQTIQRYVEFAPDGTATRDYVVRAKS